MNPVLVQNPGALWLLREIVKGNKDRSTIFNDKGVVVAQCAAEFDYLRPRFARAEDQRYTEMFKALDAVKCLLKAVGVMIEQRPIQITEYQVIA